MRYCLVCVDVVSKLQTEIDFKLTLPRNKLHPSTRYNARQPQTNALYNSSRRSFCTARVYYYMFSALLPAYTRYNIPTFLITSLRSDFTSLSLLFSLLRVSPTRNRLSTTSLQPEVHYKSNARNILLTYYGNTKSPDFNIHGYQLLLITFSVITHSTTS